MASKKPLSAAYSPDTKSGMKRSEYRGRKQWSLVLSALFLASVSFADMPKLPQFLRLQGRFTDTRIPLTDNLPIRFSIWDSADGFGNLLWEDIQNVSVNNDIFQVLLGKAKTLTPAVFSGGDRWIELQIGLDAPLKPRYKIPSQYIRAQITAVQPVPMSVAVPAVAIPEKEKARTAKKKRTAAPSEESLGPVYQVQSGDTLKSIAQKLYGNSERWYDLYYLNRDRLGPMGHLSTGQTLVLPAQTSAGTHQ